MNSPFSLRTNIAAFTMLSCMLLAPPALSDVTLTTDFTNAANGREPIYNFWSVRNEIPAYPSIGPQQPPQTNSMNCIRLLGGWSDSSGNMQKSEDVCYWDGTQYAYRWWKLTNRIDAIHAQGRQIHQLVLDNVPWDFQRDFSFGDGPDDDYPAELQVSTYGNSLPPSDPVAWSNFIKATMNKLVETYGQEQVGKWRFRIGTESDYYPHHWSGSKMDFFNHYRNTAEAVLSVLPDAKLCAHFLQAGGNGRYGAEFVRWCDANNVKYDFIAVSFYPFYNRKNPVDLERVYNVDFKPIIDQPEWNPNAQLEIPEFALFTEKDDDGFNMSVATSHSPAFYTMLAKMMYDNSMGQVQSWGDVTKDPAQLALATMLGKERHVSEKTGLPTNPKNKIDGIFAADLKRSRYDALIFSYNEDPAYIADETVNLSFDVPVPAGNPYEYRIATYDRDTNPSQLFVKKYPLAGLWVSEGGWVNNRINPTSANQTDKNGTLSQILVDPGKTLWKNETEFDQFKSLQWSSWQPVITRAGATAGESKLDLTISLSSFSFQKVEFRKKAILDPWVSQDLGSPTPSGSAHHSAGLFTIDGCGTGISGTSDQFQYVYQTITGDCEITARVLSMDNTDPGAKAGVMIRGNLGADSKIAAAFITPGQGSAFDLRLANGGSATSSETAGITAPHWVKVTRVGNLFTGLQSLDGTTWTPMGSSTVPMGQTVYLGMAVSSKVADFPCSAVFDHVKIFPPISIPVANAGVDQTVAIVDSDENAVVTLNGSQSFSSNGPIINYVWTEHGAQIATGASPSVTLGRGTHTITLNVTDDAGVSANDTVVITVANLIYSHLYDASPISNGSMGSTREDPTFFAGRAGSTPGVNRSPVFVFKLPDLGAVINPFSDASFSCHLAGLNDSTPTANVDLYGLPRRATENVVTSDYFGDAALDTGSGVTRLQDNFIPFSPFPAVPTTRSTDATAAAALADYLNQQYASGAGANQYVFLRLNNDEFMSNNIRYVFTSANGASAANDGLSDTDLWPKIQYTLPPTPIDGDDDGMPDLWEMHHFQTHAKTANGDEDGDGVSNREEYVAGTQPKDSSSLFVITSMTETAPGSGKYTLYWQSATGRTYTVLKSASLAGFWGPASDPIPGIGAELSFTDTAITGAKCFYKVQVTIP